MNPTKLWLDCEWNDSKFNGFNGELISLALVGEHATSPAFYEVLGVTDPSPWICQNVLPILKVPSVSIQEFQQKLEEFLCQFKSVRIICDWPEDIAHFCNACITGSGERIKMPGVTFEICRNLPSTADTSQFPHNALYDAFALRDSWMDGYMKFQQETEQLRKKMQEK